MKPRPLPPIDVLRALFLYDPATGVITRRIKRGLCFEPGQVAGHIHSITKYRLIKIDGLHYCAHRLAWALHHGQEPRHLIDHINGDRSDNRISNLRDVPKSTNAENQRKAAAHNISTGLLGASVDRRTGRVVANIRVNRKLIRIGSFATAQEAHAAYLAAKRQLHEGCTI